MKFAPTGKLQCLLTTCPESFAIYGYECCGSSSEQCCGSVSNLGWVLTGCGVVVTVLLVMAIFSSFFRR
ncbi:hypothetical protein DICVIV_00570 [Dictyocaulus viviparus]|uniref:Uncharacterized protein n=1 Tax=Dictyocaulus viviparus TaxID=29172 RepID=A0A0D8YB72_DICVI|nr:hypothetical protein DICVIV_00570 [Dictyocaulus viviparus]